MLAMIASVILGIIGAFLQITAVITMTPVFLIVVPSIAVVYLAALSVITVLIRRTERRRWSAVCLTATNKLHKKKRCQKTPLKFSFPGR